jgi:predicted component of type VI protein secretion system
MPVVLLIREEDEVHSVVLSKKPIVMGRSSSCDIRLSDEKISSRHLALMVNSSGKVIIKDLGSTNGTILNGSQIEDAVLMLEDQLMIGAVRLWIDPDQLSARERQILTRSESPAKLKFINLKDTSTQNAKPSAPSLPTEIKKNNLIDRAKNVSSGKKTFCDESFTGKDQTFFELEESSGNTQFIELPKATQTEKAKSKNSPKLKKKQAPEKPKGIFEKISSLFKKKD